jgi:hypothetical protein
MAFNSATKLSNTTFFFRNVHDGKELHTCIFKTFYSKCFIARASLSKGSVSAC